MDIRGGNALITGGTFNYFTSRNTAFTFLRSCIAEGAFHNSGERFDPPKCHPGTRVAVLRVILNWIQLDQCESLVMWLFGPAGAGKSALAQTIAEICFGDGRLAASFFFSRTAPKRSDSTSLILTIAYQIALNIPASRPFIEEAVETDPSICSMSLQTQLDTLIIKPLANIPDHERTTWPRLIIIDGLDECHDPKVQSSILDVFAAELRSGKLPFKLLVASRPESHISLAFQLGNIQSITTRLCLDNSFFPDADIRLFLLDKFTEVKRIHPLKHYIPACWPADDSIDELVRKSSGQFIYAATVVRYMASIYHRPTTRLQIVLGLSPIVREIDNPFAELDALYLRVLSSVDDIDITLKVLGFSLISQLQLPTWRSYNQIKLEILMSLIPGDIQLCLGNIVSLVNLGNFQVTFLHASFGDFLLDRCRSGPYYINMSDMHEYAARCHLRFLTTPNCALEHPSNCHWESTEYLSIHCGLATPTPALRNALTNLDFTTLFHNLPSTPFTDKTAFCFWDSFGRILSSVRAVEFDDTDAVQAEFLGSFDSFLWSQLEIYHRYPILIDLVTLFVVCVGHYIFRAEDNFYCHKRIWTNLHALPSILLGISISQPGDDSLIKVDQSGLRIMYIFLPDWIERFELSSEPHLYEYLQLLYMFLKDPQRSGKHVIGADKYAHAAIRCIAYLDNFQNQNASLIQSRKYTNTITIQNLQNEVYVQCLWFLCPLLAEASACEELITAIKSMKIQIPASLEVETLGGLAHEACTTYLKRYDCDPFISAASLDLG